MLCPVKKTNLTYCPDEQEGYFINEDKSLIYPIKNGIILLLETYSVSTRNVDIKNLMHSNLKAVFDYYNAITYKNFEDKTIYIDSNKWVIFDEDIYSYYQHSFAKAKKEIPEKGKYLLDIASGPIGIKEYLELSYGYETRICIDISYNALIEAKKNYKRNGVFICGDICKIPVKENVMDAVVSHHTLYHVPKNLQENAFNELYRVTKPDGGTCVVVYNWFYYSLFMNLTLLPVQIYRVLRYMASRIYSTYINKKNPKLYFYVHAPFWLKRFHFYDKIEVKSWRIANNYFLKFYFFKKFGGKKLLNTLQKWEEKYSKLFGWIGDYPMFVIKK